MKMIAALLFAALPAATVASLADAPMTRAEYIRTYRESMERTRRIRERAHEIRPRRRDHPLRYENISDREVTEIQIAARGVVPKAIVNISGVVTGCPCEEGVECTDQAWIVATRPGRSVDLQLSRIGGLWTIGPIQQFWLSMADLRAHERQFPSSYEYEVAEQKLWESFPVCLAPAKPPVAGTTVQNRESAPASRVTRSK